MRLTTSLLLEEVGSSDDTDPSSELKELLVLEVDAPYDEAADPEEKPTLWVLLCFSMLDSSAVDPLVPFLASLEPSSEEESPVFDGDSDVDADSSLVEAEASSPLLKMVIKLWRIGRLWS